MEESKLEWDGIRLTLIVKNSNMDFDEKIRKIALEDKTLGLFHGKLGACIYFYVSSNHDEDSLAYQTAKELLVQIVQKVSSVKSIDFDNGVMGLSLGLSFLMKNNYVEDTSISWLSRMDNYIYKVAIKTLDMDINDNAPKTPNDLGTRRPQYGQRVPVIWSLDARHLVPECPSDGHNRIS